MPGASIRTSNCQVVLPAPSSATAQVGLKCRVVIGQSDVKVIRQFRPAWTAGDVLRLPAEHLFKERPGILEPGLGRIFSDVRRNDRGVGLGLPRWGEAKLLEQNGRHDQADRPDEIDPLEIRITLDFRRHARHPDDGQR